MSVCRRNGRCIAHLAGFISDKDYYADVPTPMPLDRTGDWARKHADEMRELFLRKERTMPLEAFDLYREVAKIFGLERAVAKTHLYQFMYGFERTENTGDLIADCCTYMEGLGFKRVPAVLEGSWGMPDEGAP